MFVAYVLICFAVMHMQNLKDFFVYILQWSNSRRQLLP